MQFSSGGRAEAGEGDLGSGCIYLAEARNGALCSINSRLAANSLPANWRIPRSRVASLPWLWMARPSK